MADIERAARVRAAETNARDIDVAADRGALDEIEGRDRGIFGSLHDEAVAAIDLDLDVPRREIFDRVISRLRENKRRAVDDDGRFGCGFGHV